MVNNEKENGSKEFFTKFFRKVHRLSNISEGEASTGAENSLVIEFLKQ